VRTFAVRMLPLFLSVLPLVIGLRDYMFTTVIVEGLKVNAKIIPGKRVLSVWESITRKPLPRLRAFQLEDSDFDRVVRLKRSREDERREREEWGRVLSTGGTDACVFNADETSDVDYVIIVRKNLYHRLENVLEHELTHIARGDL
jgi:hypothetical protein